MTDFENSFTLRLSGKFCSKSRDFRFHYNLNVRLHYLVKQVSLFVIRCG